MRIDIKRISAENAAGFNFDYESDLSGIKRWGVRPFPDPVRLYGEVTARSGILTVCYKTVFSRREPCARCLKPARADMEAEFSHSIVETDPQGVDDGEIDGFITAPDGLLDMDSLAAADILLSIDDMLLCREDCRGLCPKCGTDLNENPCSCELKEPDPRFARLMELILSEGDGKQ